MGSDAADVKRFLLRIGGDETAKHPKKYDFIKTPAIDALDVETGKANEETHQWRASVTTEPAAVRQR